MAAARGASAPAFFERLIDTRPDCGKCWSQPAEEAGQQRQSQREEHDRPVQADLIDARQRLRQQAYAHPQSDSRQCQPYRATGDTQDHAFHDGLSEQCGRASTQGEPHRDLSSSADGTHQQKPRQVRTGDQQNDDHCKEQGAHQGSRLPHRIFMQWRHHRVNAKTAHVGRIVAHRLLGHSLRIALRLLGSDAGL